MASFHFLAWWQYALWQLAGLAGGFVVNSFVEWAVHRFIMHRPSRLIPYGYDHVTSHHATFGCGKTYEVVDEWMREHGIAFTWREYVLFPLACSAIYAPAELLAGRPIFLGAMASVFAGLVAFDALHSRFHAPRGGRLERWRLFRFLNRHHLLHHERHGKNLNVVMPLADLCLGTLVTTAERPDKILPV